MSPVSEVEPQTAAAEIDSDDLRRSPQTLKAGVAVVDPLNWTIRFENEQLFKCFPLSGEFRGHHGPSGLDRTV